MSRYVYPYTRASNGLTHVSPVGYQKRTDKMLEGLKESRPAFRAQREMDEPSALGKTEWRGSGGGAGVTLIQVVNPALRKYEGMNFDEIGRQHRQRSKRRAPWTLQLPGRGKVRVRDCDYAGSDVRAVVSSPLVTYGSDSPAQAEDGPLSTTKAHPRAFGTFPRVLAEYVRLSNHALG